MMQMRRGGADPGGEARVRPDLLDPVVEVSSSWTMTAVNAGGTMARLHGLLLYAAERKERDVRKRRQGREREEEKKGMGEEGVWGRRRGAGQGAAGGEELRRWGSWRVCGREEVLVLEDELVRGARWMWWLGRREAGGALGQHGRLRALQEGGAGSRG